MLRYASERDKANHILNLTSLTVEQFDQLVDPSEQAFVRHMKEWTREGKPRTARAYTPYANSPLPTPEDRLFFLLCYLNVAALQVAHAALFGMTSPTPIRGCMCCCWCCIRRCVILAMHLHAICVRCVHGCASFKRKSQRRMRLPPFVSRWHGATDCPPARRC